MYRERVPYYRKLEQLFESKLLVYITSDRPNMAAQIAPDVIEYFIDHLDKMRLSCDKISLFLYTRGGNTSAARNIVNLLRMYCENLQVIVPYKAHSAGTIISLGANEIVMTKQATLGPIDPSLHTPLNPRVEGSIYPVSVEAVKGYLGFAKDELGISDTASLTSIFEKLTDFVHPLVLGEVYRSKALAAGYTADSLVAKANELLDRAKSDPEGAKNEAVSILNALGVSVSDAKVTVNGNDITISANINGTYVPYSFNNADTHPEIGEAIKNGTWGVAESTTTAAASLKSGNGVIKATGDNAGIAMLVAVVAIAGTMGVAVRKSRDAE